MDRSATRCASASSSIVGKPMGPPLAAPDPVNVPMIRHWVDALDDRNPVYLDEAFAATHALRRDRRAARDAPGVGDGAAEDRGDRRARRRGDGDHATTIRSARSTRPASPARSPRTPSSSSCATCGPGDHLHAANEVESISPRKTTALGQGYFVTWVTTYTADDEVVGRQLFRVFKFDPRTIGARAMTIEVGDELPVFELPRHLDGDRRGRDRVARLHARAPRRRLRARAGRAAHVHEHPHHERLRRALRHRLGRARGDDCAASRSGSARPRSRARRCASPAASRRCSDEGDERVIEVAVRAANDLGDHATGTVARRTAVDERVALRPRCAAREVPRRARQAAAHRRHRAVRRAHREVRALRARSVCGAGLHARAAHRRGRRRADRRRLRRAARGRAAARARRRERSASSRRAATSAARGTGTATRGSRATSSRTSTCRCSKSSATCRSRSTAAAPEILAHCQAIAKRYDLYRDACFQTAVTEIRWDADASRWIVATDRGDAMRARFVVLSNGFLQKPKLPGIPGIETFRGPRVPHQPLGLRLHGRRRERQSRRPRDKRVGIIGTGATAVQCIPHLGASARTPLRVPAHAVVDRRAREPPDRSRVGEQPRAGLAAEAGSRTSRSSPRAAMRPKTS